MNTTQQSEQSAVVSPLAEAASAPTGAFCTHTQCRGQSVAAEFAFIHGDWVVKAACSQHATIRKDGAPWTLTDAQDAAAQYRRAEADFHDRTAARKEPAVPTSRKQPAVVVSAKRDRDEIVWQFLAAIVEIREQHKLRIVEAAEDLLERRPLCKEGKRASGILRFESGDIVEADWPHFLAARMVFSFARNAGKRVNFHYFWNKVELAEFQERRRRAAIEREKKDADARRAKARPGRSPQPENRPPTGTTPTGYGTTKPMPKGKRAKPGESTHSEEAREQNHETAVATEHAARTGKSLFEAQTELGLRDPVVEELIETDSVPASMTQIAAFKEQMKTKAAPTKAEKKLAKKNRRADREAMA